MRRIFFYTAFRPKHDYIERGFFLAGKAQNAGEPEGSARLCNTARQEKDRSDSYDFGRRSVSRLGARTTEEGAYTEIRN